MRKIILSALTVLALAIPGCKKTEVVSGDAGTYGDAGVMPQAPRKLGVAPLSKVSQFQGANVSAAEFGSARIGKLGTDYTWNPNSQYDYLASKNANISRINFTWERMQPVLNGPLDPTYSAALINSVNYANSKGLTVLLNPQNFARYNTGTTSYVIGSTQVPNTAFADFWRKLATLFKGNDKVICGLVNEPHDIATEQWLSGANAAIKAIRGVGFTGLVSVPGSMWTGLGSWMNGYSPYTANSKVMLGVIDSGNNFVYETHSYLDNSQGGDYADNTCPRDGVADLTAVAVWLRQNNKKMIIGEFGAPNNASCQAKIQSFEQYLHDNSDVYIGGIWWSSGIWWDNYKLTLQPTNLGKSNQADDPKMAWLQPFWSAATSPTTSIVASPTTTATTTPTAPVDAGTVIMDAGITDSGAKDAGATTADAGTVISVLKMTATNGLVIDLQSRNIWNGGYCKTIVISNPTKTNLAWHEFRMDLKDGSLRDIFGNIRTPNASWGTKGIILVKPGTPQWIMAGKTLAGVSGFCADSKGNQNPSLTLAN
jgi:endoglucanase